MLKLVAHIAAAILMIFITGAIGAPVWLRAGLVILGAICVHMVWERVFSNPFLDLGSRPYSPNDPVLIEARTKAMESMHRLHELFPEHRKDTVVRFRFSVPGEADEFLWGDLLELSREEARVFVRTFPTQEPARMALKERTMTVPTASIDDWQIELHDGSLLGGFTNQAMFKIYEREEGHLHPAFIEQIARIRDRLDGAPFAGVTWQVGKND